MLFTIRLVGFLLTSFSPHGLVLTSDSTFPKHELLFVLSSYIKYCHTSLSSSRPASKFATGSFLLGKFSNLALTDDRNSRCLRSPDIEFQRYSKVRLNTEEFC